MSLRASMAMCGDGCAASLDDKPNGKAGLEGPINNADAPETNNTSVTLSQNTTLTLGSSAGPESETLSLSPISKSYQGGPGAMWQGEDLSVDPYTTGNTYAKAEQLEFDLPGSYSVAPSGSTNGQQHPAVIVDGSEPPATQSLSNVGGLNAASPITWVNETVTNGTTRTVLPAKWGNTVGLSE
jgi:hypothetical protein